jgi:hypothetical protein
MRGNVPGVGFFEGGPDVGANIEAQRQALYNMPFRKRAAVYNAIVDKMIEDNPELATNYTGYMAEPTHQKENMNALFGGIDALTVGQSGKALFSTARKLLFKKTVADMARSAAEHAPLADAENVPAAVAAATGDLVEAGINKVTPEVAAQLKGTVDPRTISLDGIQSVFKNTVDAIEAGGAGNTGSEVLNRIRERLNTAMSQTLNAVVNVSKIMRISDVLASKVVMKQVYNEIKNRYPGLSGNVINIKPVRWDPVRNGFSADVIHARNDGSFFASPQEAFTFARDNGITIERTSYGGEIRGKRPERFGGGELPETGAVLHHIDLQDSNIYYQGRGYYIAVNRPIDESKSFIQNMIAETAKSQNINKGLANRLGFGWIRTPSETLSEQEMTNRQVAIYAPAIFKKIVSDAYAAANVARGKLVAGPQKLLKNPFAKGGRSSFSELKENLFRGNEFETGVKELATAQKDFTNISDLEQWWNQRFGHMPTATQVEGYFGLLTGQRMDYIFRNTLVLKNMHRVGGETHTLVKIVDGVPVRSKGFVGVIQTTIPNSDDNVMIQDGNTFRTPKRLNNLQNSKEGKEIAKGIEDGTWKLIKVYDPDLNELNEFAGQTKDIHYVLTKTAETRPLEWKQLPMREGGHIEYPYEYYLKQANISADIEAGRTVRRYKGDNTAMALDSRAFGKDAAATMNKVREYIKDGNVDEAKKLVISKLPIPWTEVESMFKSKGPIPARFDVNEPFYVVPKNKTIADIENHFNSYTDDAKRWTFYDNHTSGSSLAKQAQVEFTGARDAYGVFAMENTGTQLTPHFSYRPADIVNPFDSINRAVTRIINSTYMDDVKISSVQAWIERARPYLDATPAEIAHNPYGVFARAKLKTGTDINTKSMLEAQRYQIKAFAGIPSILDTFLHGLSEKMADSIYASQSPVTKGVKIAAKWSFDTAVEVPAFLRAVTYRADIGLFSLPQLLVQSNTYVTIAGLAGYKKAGQGATAAMLHQWSRLPYVTEDIMKELDKRATKFGWRPGEWREAYDELAKTGFEYVGPETNQTMGYGHMYPNKIAKTALGDFLDMSEIFFKGAERNSRYGAWYTAFKEFRDANPTGRLTVSDRNKILNRADDLSGNMTRASKSLLQTGFGSFPSQFLGYQLRLMEQFTGKRLTMQQRARLIATYAGVYGVPVSTGVVSVIPANDWMKNKAIEYGYVEGKNAVADTLMQGVPYMLLKLITGHKYNVGERYGSPGLDVVNDVLAGDKPFWTMFMGASGGLVTDAWEKADPFIKQMASWLRGNNAWNLTADDVAGLARIPASGNNMVRLVEALHTGNWLSKHENLLARDITPANALWMAFSGLQPSDVAGLKQYQQLETIQKNLETNAENEYILHFRRGLRDMAQGNFTGADTHMRIAHAGLERSGYPMLKRDALLARAMDGRTAPERKAWNYWASGQNTPAGQELERQKRYLEIQQQREQ